MPNDTIAKRLDDMNAAIRLLAEAMSDATQYMRHHAALEREVLELSRLLTQERAQAKAAKEV